MTTVVGCRSSRGAPGRVVVWGGPAGRVTGGCFEAAEYVADPPTPDLPADAATADAPPPDADGGGEVTPADVVDAAPEDGSGDDGAGTSDTEVGDAPDTPDPSPPDADTGDLPSDADDGGPPSTCLIERMHQPSLRAAVARLGLAPIVERIAELNAEYGELLNAPLATAPDFDEVRAAERPHRHHPGPLCRRQLL